MAGKRVRRAPASSSGPSGSRLRQHRLRARPASPGPAARTGADRPAGRPVQQRRRSCRRPTAARRSARRACAARPAARWAGRRPLWMAVTAAQPVGALAPRRQRRWLGAATASARRKPVGSGLRPPGIVGRHRAATDGGEPGGQAGMHHRGDRNGPAVAQMNAGAWSKAISAIDCRQSAGGTRSRRGSASQSSGIRRSQSQRTVPVAWQEAVPTAAVRCHAVLQGRGRVRPVRQTPHGVGGQEPRASVCRRARPGYQPSSCSDRHHAAAVAANLPTAIRP